jgi:hypothetical protein
MAVSEISSLKKTLGVIEAEINRNMWRSGENEISWQISVCKAGYRNRGMVRIFACVAVGGVL